MANETNDLDGAIAVRKMMVDYLLARGFNIIPSADVDQRLREEGFTDGGQLRAATPQELARWLGADALLYSTLEEFRVVNLGFYWSRSVRIGARLVRGDSGEVLWSGQKAAQTTGVAANKDEAMRQFAAQLAAVAVERMTHTPLKVESHRAVQGLLATLP